MQRDEKELQRKLCELRAARQRGLPDADSDRLNRMCCVVLRYALGELNDMYSPDQEKDCS